MRQTASFLTSRAVRSIFSLVERTGDDVLNIHILRGQRPQEVDVVEDLGQVAPGHVELVVAHAARVGVFTARVLVVCGRPGRSQPSQAQVLVFSVVHEFRSRDQFSSGVVANLANGVQQSSTVGSDLGVLAVLKSALQRRQRGRTDRPQLLARGRPDVKRIVAQHSDQVSHIRSRDGPGLITLLCRG